MTKIEIIERKQQEEASKYKIMDQYFLTKEAETRSARDAKSAKIIAWVSLGISVVGAVAAIIALFK